ncbi:hypothetical protein FOCC_FOCC005662 [Frankliniella occidentalis]|nr:hypothetical protein FOCC_FOCC005662 [Frankliniella occidentalis]
MEANVRNCIIDNGFQVVKSTRTTITKHQAAAFYSEHKERFFYNRLITFMCSGPSEVYILARKDAIRTWRELMGPTKVYQAVYTAPNTIRANYGLSDTRNATHGSDSVESALREIEVFFPSFDYEKWIVEDEPYFSSGKVQFDEENFVHRALKS